MRSRAPSRRSTGWRGRPNGPARRSTSAAGPACGSTGCCSSSPRFWAVRPASNAGPTSPATCRSPPPTCAAPVASWGIAPAWASRTGSAASPAGTRRRMDVSPEHQVGQARERFQLQDYYGAIHLLEDVVASGRAFADAHHLLGLSYCLAGQPDKALSQFDRALGLNPNYVEALIHRALVLNELGREDEAIACLSRAGSVGGEARHGFPAHVAAKLAWRGPAGYLGGGGRAARPGWEEGGGRRREAPRVGAYRARPERNAAAPVPAPPAKASRGGRRKRA